MRLLIKHIGFMLALLGIILVGFFYGVLPTLTRHGQAIVVPDLKGISVIEAEPLLAQRKLRLQVTREAAYSNRYPAGAVLRQNPLPGAEVKRSRTIYVTINSENPPQIKMPNLLNGSIRNAQMVLKSHDLLLGEVTYVPDIAQDAVLAQRCNGKDVEPGRIVGRGTKIDIVVGAGLGQHVTAVPDVAGKTLEEATFTLLNAGFKVGSLVYELLPDKPSSTVFKQMPEPGTPRKTGSLVDLWIVNVSSPNSASSGEENEVPPSFDQEEEDEIEQE